MGKENDTKETEEKETEEKVLPVSLGEIPTEYGLVYQTPDGVMKQEQYLAWIGNKLVSIEQALVGS